MPGLKPRCPAPQRHHPYPANKITSNTPARTRKKLGLVCQKSYTAYNRKGRASNQIPKPISAVPPAANKARVETSFCRAQSDAKKNPAANPANANADHGNTGNSQGCGVPKVWTPF